MHIHTKLYRLPFSALLLSLLALGGMQNLAAQTLPDFPTTGNQFRFATLTEKTVDSLSAPISLVPDSIFFTPFRGSYSSATGVLPNPFRAIYRNGAVVVYPQVAHNIPTYTQLAICGTGRNPSDGIYTIGCLANTVSAPTVKYSKGYYSATEAKSGDSLFFALRRTLATGYRSNSYNTTRDNMFLQYDNKRVNGQGATVNTLECVYTGRVISGYASRTEAQDNVNNFNTEHTFPQSFFSSAQPMQADAHHLFAVDEGANTRRSNNPFSIVTSPIWEVGGSKLGSGPTPGNWFEPRDVHKGNCARAMCYFVARYGDYAGFFASQQNTLVQWSLNYAPDTVAKRRNSAILATQGNRNPFVDYPQLLQRMRSLTGNRTTFALSQLAAFPAQVTVPSNRDSVDVYILVAATGTVRARATYPTTLPSGIRYNVIRTTPGDTLRPGLGEQLILRVRNTGITAPTTDTIRIQNLDGTGANATAILVIKRDGITSLRSAVALPALTCFPNPTSGLLDLKAESIAPGELLTIRNSLGSIVATAPLSPTHSQIDLSPYPAGIYVLTTPRRTPLRIVKN
jgi:endonuclease I